MPTTTSTIPRAVSLRTDSPLVALHAEGSGDETAPNEGLAIRGLDDVNLPCTDRWLPDYRPILFLCHLMHSKFVDVLESFLSRGVELCQDHVVCLQFELVERDIVRVVVDVHVGDRSTRTRTRLRTGHTSTTRPFAVAHRQYHTTATSLARHIRSIVSAILDLKPRQWRASGKRIPSCLVPKPLSPKP